MNETLERPPIRTWGKSSGLDAIQALLVMEYAENLENQVARLRDAARWIPTAEREPTTGEHVMVCSHRPAYGNQFGFVEWLNGRGWERMYSHWRPLPEPPEVTP